MSEIMQKLGLPAHGKLSISAPMLKKFLMTHNVSGVTRAMINTTDGLKLHLDVDQNFGIEPVAASL